LRKIGYDEKDISVILTDISNLGIKETIKHYLNFLSIFIKDIMKNLENTLKKDQNL